MVFHWQQFHSTVLAVQFCSIATSAADINHSTKKKSTGTFIAFGHGLMCSFYFSACFCFPCLWKRAKTPEQTLADHEEAFVYELVSYFSVSTRKIFHKENVLITIFRVNFKASRGIQIVWTRRNGED